MRSFMWFVIGMLFTSTIGALTIASLEHERVLEQQNVIRQAHELLNQNPFENMR